MQFAQVHTPFDKTCITKGEPGFQSKGNMVFKIRVVLIAKRLPWQHTYTNKFVSREIYFFWIVLQY